MVVDDFERLRVIESDLGSNNAMMFLYIDEKVQSVIVVSFDRALAQLSEMTIQFELLQTVLC